MLHADEIYAVALGSCVVVLLGWNLAAALAAQRARTLALARKYLGQTVVCPRFNGSTDATVLVCLGVAALVAANVTACCIFVHNLAELSHRTAILALINLIPLCAGTYSSIWAEVLCGSHLQAYRTGHRWFGRVYVILGAVHSTIELLRSRQTAGYLNISLLVTLSLLALLSLLPLRRRFFEWFTKTHHLLGIGLLACLWIHIPRGLNGSTLCLASATFVWTSQLLLWTIRAVLRNVGGRVVKSCAIVPFEAHGGPVDALVLRLSLRRSWVLHHGQYVYITIPGMHGSFTSSFQSHPYMVAWAQEKAARRVKDIQLVVQCQNGFSDMLRSCKEGASIWLDGPYGKGPDLDDFDTVLLIASGVGLTAHLLAIRHLLLAHNDRTARVRRISLLWVLESNGQEAWAQSFIDELMDLDSRSIFTVIVSSPAAQGSETISTTVVRQSHRERYYHVDGQVDLDWLLLREFSAEAGNMAVSLCATPLLEHKTRAAIRRSQHDILLYTTAFQLDESISSRKNTQRFEGKVSMTF